MTYLNFIVMIFYNVIIEGDYLKRMNLFNNFSKIIDLREYRISPSPGVNASRPKYQITTPSGDVYFKFKMTDNEIGAELFSYHIAKFLDIQVAMTQLATYKKEIGIASYDIGYFLEPDDFVSYSIKDYLNISGFIEMCLFDYLIMNEDRHAGNWGIIDNKVAPLFDHNNCFGGSEGFVDLDYFMTTVTSAFYVDTEYQQRHDMILKFLTKKFKSDVDLFMNKINTLKPIRDSSLEYYNSQICDKLNKILFKRIEYMNMKVREFYE